MKKTWLVGVIVGVVLLVLAGGVLRALSERQAKQAKQAALASPQGVEVTLLPTEVLTLRPQELTQSVPLSGSLKAADAVVVKARVPGELVELSVREGDTVQAGQVLARVDPLEYTTRLQQAQEQAAAAQAQVTVAQRSFDNNKALVEQGFISRTALDTSEANLNAAKATHRAALSAVELARKSLADTVLKSPISGQVAQRMAQRGERVGMEARIVEVVDLRQIELEATLSAADAAALRVGQTATLQIEGGSASGGERSAAAQVVRINPSAQAGSRSVLVYLRLDGSSGLRQGLFAQGRVQVGTSTALALPVSALRTDKPVPYVQAVVDGLVQHLQVQPGLKAQLGQQSWVALDGLAEGTQVVVGSIGALREGTRIKLASAAPAPASTSPAGATRAAP
jgi:RND family efflux transporter MFP subunit